MDFNSDQFDSLQNKLPQAAKVKHACSIYIYLVTFFHNHIAFLVKSGVQKEGTAMMKV